MPDETNLEEQLAEAQSRIESLETAAADAEARAQTLQERLSDAEAEAQRLREAEGAAQGQVAEAESAAETARRDLAETGKELDAVRSHLRQATLKYREARLASAPEIPAELVPESEPLEEIERDFESAQRVVGELRRKLEDEAEAGRRSARVPAGSPPRREADVSSLSATEKIRLGLEQRG
jgi:chromosome segregation ATPase